MNSPGGHSFTFAHLDDKKSPHAIKDALTPCLHSGCCSGMLMWASAILNNCAEWQSAKCQKRFTSSKKKKKY